MFDSRFVDLVSDVGESATETSILTDRSGSSPFGLLDGFLSEIGVTPLEEDVPADLVAAVADRVDAAAREARLADDVRDPESRPVTRILVDADACPVKEEIYRVARRTRVPVVLVSNSWMDTPTRPWLSLVVVDDAFDAADDWIVANATDRDIVITADIPLAARSLETGARVIGPKGRPFTAESIGEALASREVQSHLRELGISSGGPAPFEKKDRSRFLQRLDQEIQALRREQGT